ncbi:hypothetical protein Catovirus_1_452 [Catovirus CTV1]|uniref:Uncharacterized protein n=1 Tax=Catovirus CTV1 TaxID=1977631 RepID=A0A1V0S9M2_9VIRU|nr:hypothetical protein Catovirus_1_452 [Catovirus CTV1]
MICSMDSLNNIVKKYKSYYFGSYVYNKLLKDNNDYDDIDIMTKDVDAFLKDINDNFRCKTLNISFGEYGFINFIKIKCNELEKDINIFEKIFTEFHMDVFDRGEYLYDFQRIFYDPLNNTFKSFDKKMDLQYVMSNYKNNKICYVPSNIGQKYSNRFSLQRNNIFECIRKDYDSGYSWKEIKEYVKN